MGVMRRVQRNGVVTLPKELRRRSGLREGDYVRIAYENGRIVITACHIPVEVLPPRTTEPCGQFIDLRARQQPHLARRIQGPSTPRMAA